MLSVTYGFLILSFPYLSAEQQLPFEPSFLHTWYLPLPEKYPIVDYKRQFSFNAADPKTLDGWDVHGTAAVREQSILLTAPKRGYQVGSIYQREKIPATIRNWRIEAIITTSAVHKEDCYYSSAPSLGLFVATADSLHRAPTRGKLLGNLQGFLTYMGDRFDGGPSIIETISNDEPAGSGAYYDEAQNDDVELCSDNGTQLKVESEKGLLLIVQNVDDKITVAYAGPSKFNEDEIDYHACVKNWNVSGLSALITDGTLHVGLSGFAQGQNADIYAHSLDFYSLSPVTSNPPIRDIHTPLYYGPKIGSLITAPEESGSPDANGVVHAASLTTIVIVNFTFDGELTPAHFLASNELAYPSDQPGSTIVPNELGQFSTLRKYDAENVVLHLPKQITTKSMKWFAVWNRQTHSSAGSVLTPKNFQAPFPINIGPFDVSDEDIMANITALDSKTIHVNRFTFTKRHHSSYFMAWPYYSDHGFALNFQDSFTFGNIVPPMENMVERAITLRLPPNVTVKDLKSLSVHSPYENVTYAHVRLKKAEMERLPSAEIRPAENRIFPTDFDQVDGCKHLDKQFEVRWKSLHRNYVLNRKYVMFHYLFSVGKFEYAAVGFLTEDVRQRDSNVTDLWVAYWNHDKNRAIVSRLLILGLPQQCLANASIYDGDGTCYVMNEYDSPIVASSNTKQQANTNATEVSFIIDINSIAPGDQRSFVWAIGPLEFDSASRGGNAVFLAPTKSGSAVAQEVMAYTGDTSQCTGVFYEKPRQPTTTPSTHMKKVRYPVLPVETNTMPKYSVEKLQESCKDFANFVIAPPNYNHATMVHLILVVDKLVDLNDGDGTIHIGGMLFSQWEVTTCESNDTFKDKTEAQWVSLAAPDSVWRPNLIFRSSSDDVSMQSGKFVDEVVVIMEKTPEQQNTGSFSLRFLRSQIGIFRSKCNPVVQSFPYDLLTCKLEFSLQRTYDLVRFGELDMELPVEFPECDGWNLLNDKMNVNEILEKTIVESTVMRRKVSTAIFTMTFKRSYNYYGNSRYQQDMHRSSKAADCCHHFNRFLFFVLLLLLLATRNTS